jgi:hypothetical protein
MVPIDIMDTTQNITPHQCKFTSAALIGFDQSRLFASGAMLCRLVANSFGIILFRIKGVNGIAKSGCPSWVRRTVEN